LLKNRRKLIKDRLYDLLLFRNQILKFIFYSNK
jgi:hypothetical protein